MHEKLLFELASPISSQQWDTCSSLKKKNNLYAAAYANIFLFCRFNDLYFAPAKYS